jgi:hypothetical protein
MFFHVSFCRIRQFNSTISINIEAVIVYVNHAIQGREGLLQAIVVVGVAEGTKATLHS